MSDMDNIALNLDRESRANGLAANQYVDLHEFIVDPERSLAFSQKKCANIWNQRWTITRTENNDRARCKLTRQKAMVI